MATDDGGPDGSATEARACRACRGTGRVISNLGGTPSEVICPWCDGTGHWLPDHDAQSRFTGEQGSEAGRSV